MSAYFYATRIDLEKEFIWAQKKSLKAEKHIWESNSVRPESKQWYVMKQAKCSQWEASAGKTVYMTGSGPILKRKSLRD